jgi:hypothetical protein
MPRGRVHDLVPQHGRQLGLRIQLDQQAAVDGDLAARQCPGIRYRAVQHDELVGQVAVADGGELLPDGSHIGRQRRIAHVVAALHLARRQILRLADGDLVVGRYQRQLPLAGDRVDRAACGQQRGREQRGQAGAEQAGGRFAGSMTGVNEHQRKCRPLCRSDSIDSVAIRF